MKRRAIVYYLRTGQIRLALTVLFMPAGYALAYHALRVSNDFMVSEYRSKNWRSAPSSGPTR